MLTVSDRAGPFTNGQVVVCRTRGHPAGRGPSRKGPVWWRVPRVCRTRGQGGDAVHQARRAR